MQSEIGALILSHIQPSSRGIYVCEVNTTGFEPVSAKRYQLNVIGKSQETFKLS